MLACSGSDGDAGSGGGTAGAAGDAGADGGSSLLWPTDTWEVHAPGDEGMDATVLEQARDYAFMEGKNTQGVVIVRRGAIVAEWYAQGADETSYAASWSVGKSFASALIGIAIDEGKIPGVEVSMADYFPDWAGTEKEAITLEHVLQMASGRAWVEDYSPGAIEASNIIRMVLAEPDELAYAASIGMETKPGTRFNYSSGDSMLLSGVVEVATGMSALEYAKQKLFTRVGMTAVDWWRDAAGHTLTYCCVDTPTRDFARFGLLYERGGRWGTAHVVPEAWVTASTTPSPTFQGYGYKWWLTGQTEKRLPPDTYSARGHDGQYIYVVPSLELVAVRNGAYAKFDGEPVADPNLFGKYPSDGLVPDQGTLPPDEWSDVAFLSPIIESVVDD